MKKIFVGLVLCAVALVMACESKPAAKAAAPAPAASAGGFVWEGSDVVIRIAENKPYNYQGLFEVPGLKVEKDKRIVISIEGTSDVDIALLKVFLVDNTSGWTVLSGYDDFSTEPIKAGEPFAMSHTVMSVTGANGPVGNKISFYVEFGDAKAPATLNLSSIKVEQK